MKQGWVFILARAGSKRCVGKNIRSFTGGMNLVDIAMTKALALRDMGKVDWVVLSTDIEDLIAKYKGRPNILVDRRPNKLCGDGISTEAVLLEFMDRVDMPEWFVLLQPTSPLLSIETLVEALRVFRSGVYPALISVNSEYKPNGAFYFCKTKDFQQWESLWPEGIQIVKLDSKESIDINYDHEFRIAQAVHNYAPVMVKKNEGSY